MTIRKKIILLIPFCLECIFVIYSCYIFATTEYFISIKHLIGFLLVFGNSFVYFKIFKYGLIITGFTLLLATFNAISLFPEISYFSYFINLAGLKISTPNIQGYSLLLLFIYAIITWKYFLNIYFDRKYPNQD